MNEQDNARLIEYLRDMRDHLEKLEAKIQWGVMLLGALLATNGTNVALRLPEISDSVSSILGGTHGQPIPYERNTSEVDTIRAGTPSDLRDY